MAQARAFSHVGITVPDLDKAVDFYTRVFGWYVIMKPTLVEEDDSAIGVMCKDVFGKGFGKFRIAHMSTSDKIGVELFEWPDTVTPKNNLEYRKSGIFHFCIQDPEIEETVKTIVANGGRAEDAHPRVLSRGSALSDGLRRRPIRKRVRAVQPQLRAHVFQGGIPGLVPLQGKIRPGQVPARPGLPALRRR